MRERQAFRDLSTEEQKKRKYFAGLSRQVVNELKLHSRVGLWNRVDGKRDWENVSKHCLVEVARVGVLARMLGLREDVQKDLQKAAALHDFFKQKEKNILEVGNRSQRAMEVSEDISQTMLEVAGFSPRVVRLAGSVGHNSLEDTRQVLAKGTLSDDDKAFLIMHYVDDISMNDEWVHPAEVTFERGVVSQFDLRMDAIDRNTRYAEIKKTGAYKEQRRVGHLVENQLARLLSQRAKWKIEPWYVPQYIDSRIKTDIAQTPLKKAA